MAILEVNNLTMLFGSLAALKDISLSVKPGEILGLIGPNGAGKTTFFNCITGYLACSEGSIHFRGKEITGLPPHRICHLGICRTFQIVQIFQEMTVLENVMMGSFCREAKTRKSMALAEEILAFTGLADKGDQIAGSLTLVDQKRIELARAMATQPGLLLLDEVMSGLNPTEMEEAVELIRKVHQRGLPLIVVEHVMEVIMKISNRIAVFDSGELIADGPPEKIARNERVIEAYLGQEYNA
ncbi:MAG TPA: ABC transporter ATP-binding protein [Acidobacteriota bacterium]|nr:ABC transporter ATP-binding protein [Acidobacteriota bacterium]